MNAETFNLKGFNPKNCLVPENLLQNVDAVAELIRLQIKGFKMDCFLAVISIVACHTRKDGMAAQLRMTDIKKIVPQGDRYLMALIKLGIIIRSGQYVPGIKSFKYDFSKYFRSKCVSIQLTDMKLVRRLNKVLEQHSTIGAKSVHKYNDQVRYIKKLSIADGWKDVIEDNFKDDPNRYNSNMASATRIINHDWFYTRDETSGRYHSNVTNSSRLLRPFLRVNGEPLCNIDVKNCQPYLSIILLTNPGKVSWLTKNPTFAMLLQTLEVSNNVDVMKYVKLVISGQMYEYLMAEFEKEGIVLTRNDTKNQMLRILFARNNPPKNELNRKCRNVFKKCFPTVHKIFSKVRGSDKGDKFTSYKRFAILLQSIESNLILDKILKRIYKELPGVIAITVHDSIMTGLKDNEVEAVQKIMIEEFTNFVGFSPKIKIEGKVEDNNKRKGDYKLNIMIPQPLYVAGIQ